MTRRRLKRLLSLLVQLLLLFLYVGLYRALFFRGLYVPRFGTLLTVACLAALPAITAGTALLLAGVAQPTVAAVHALLSGALFFAAATRVRLGDERPDLAGAQPEDAPLAAAPDLAASLATPMAADAPTADASDEADVPDPGPSDEADAPDPGASDADEAVPAADAPDEAAPTDDAPDEDAP